MAVVKLVAPIKLLPTEKQRRSLLKTLRAANAACSEISEMAWEQKVFPRFSIHKIAYSNIRESTGLGSQVVIQCISKVAACYRGDKKHRHSFRPHAAQPFDDRIFRLCEDDIISIWTLDGRIKVPFVCGDYQREMLVSRKGEVDLQIKGSDFFIAVTCDIEESPEIEPVDHLGVDMGIVNIAYDSDGDCHTGETVEKIRRIFSHRRRNLQRKQTRAAKRKLRAIAGRQARFQRDTNHCISKDIVQKAQRTRRAIALEDLKGIRSRATARRRQRARMSNWGFAQLRTFIEYKAKLAGIPVVFVDPRHTSQECPLCGHVSRSNRRTRDSFCCTVCGHAGPADHIAARNIRARVAVNRPNGLHHALQGSEPDLSGQLQATG